MPGARVSSSRTRAPGSTVTVPMSATATVASALVSSHAPTGSVERPLAVVTCQAGVDRRSTSVNTAPPTTSASVAAMSSAARLTRDAARGLPPQLERRRRRGLREDVQGPLDPLDLRVAAPCVPEVVAHVSFSRSSFMPRCRLTRTDPGVSPVRSAISSPVMPSTSRSTSVSE